MGVLRSGFPYDPKEVTDEETLRGQDMCPRSLAGTGELGLELEGLTAKLTFSLV